MARCSRRWRRRSFRAVVCQQHIYIGTDATTLAQGSTNNAVLRSDRFGTGHRLGIQNAPAGGPLQITVRSHRYRTHRKARNPGCALH